VVVKGLLDIQNKKYLDIKHLLARHVKRLYIEFLGHSSKLLQIFTYKNIENVLCFSVADL